MGKKLSDEYLAEVIRQECGLPGMVTLMGWCVVYSMAGCQGLDDIIRSKVGSRATRYRVASQIQRIRARLAREGFDLTEQLEDPEQLLKAAGFPKGAVPV